MDRPPDDLPCLAVALGGDGAGVDDINVAGFLRRQNEKTLGGEFFRDGFGFVLIDFASEGIDPRGRFRFPHFLTRFFPVRDRFRILLFLILT